MTNTPSPPPLARWLIARIAPPTDRPWLLDDLEELYAIRYATSGALRAAAWYWSQTLRSILPLAGSRLRPRVGHRSLRSQTMSSPFSARLGERVNQGRYHLRHAVRRLWREPSFTAAAVLTLALGVGANVAVFAVVEAVLLRPLGYPEADRLVILNHRDQRTGITKEFIAIGDYVDIVKRQSAFEGVAGYGTGQGTINDDAGQSFRAVSLIADPRLLELLRMRPAVGRNLEASDARPEAGRVVMLGYDLWMTRFRGNRSIVGQSLRLDDKPFTVVGVAAPKFQFPPNAARSSSCR
jgi:MacB-like protein